MLHHPIHLRNIADYLSRALAVFFGGILLAKLTGHWHSHITYEEYRLLIPQVSNLGQP